MTVLSEVLAANESYAESFGDRADLALPPARGFAILNCMDTLDPAKYAGLSEGDAHVIRNAGGRASDDAIRSLVISYKLLGTKEWFVIHHTRLQDGVLNRRHHPRTAGEQRGDRGARGGRLLRGGHRTRFDRGEVRRLAHDQRQRPERGRGRDPDPVHPLVPSTIPIYGYLYDVSTGRLVEVPEATKAGAVG